MWLAIAQSGRAVLLSVAAAAAAAVEKELSWRKCESASNFSTVRGMHHSIQWGNSKLHQRRLCVARLRDVENMGGKGGEERRGEEGCAGSPRGGAAV
jgi:hypothetical protein